VLFSGIGLIKELSMRIAVIGVNYKLADLELREQLAKCCEKRFAAQQLVHTSCTYVLLSTCNRTEIYFSSEDLTETHSYILNILRDDIEAEFDQKLYSYFGNDCFAHLCRVTAGLDSAILGETEIQRQVKIAYEYATKCSLLPKQLHYLFQKALKIGKQLRSQCMFDQHLPDIEDAIFHVGKENFAENKKTKVLFVGASAINRKVIAFFNHKKIPHMTLCNRSLSVAEELAQKYQLQLLPWEDLSLWYEFDWIIFGTKAPHHLICKESIPKQGVSPKLLIDLGMPRNVNSNIANEHIALFNIDQLNAPFSTCHSSIPQAFSLAETMIAQTSQLHIALFQQKEEQRALLAREPL